MSLSLTFCLEPVPFHRLPSLDHAALREQLGPLLRRLEGSQSLRSVAVIFGLGILI
jgi:hypothetical protein